MPKVVEHAKSEALYERDIHVWFQEQAALLRDGRLSELDAAHLLEEIEDLGANLRSAVFSRTEQIIRHLLKLEHSQADEPRRLWRQSIRDQRDELDLRLTQSLRKLLNESLATRYARARRRALEDQAEHEERPAIPESCPYTLDAILTHDWFPKSRRSDQA